MNGERSADEANASRSRAESVEPFGTRANNLGLVAQAEVVVRREDQHLAAALHLNTGRLRGIEIVEPLVHSILLQLLDAFLELVVELPVERHSRFSVTRFRKSLCLPRRT